ncbi:hypothetical protein [Gluconobacter morbifer]|nr:hypothetical protein [Gluconobacter morbifer]
MRWRGGHWEWTGRGYRWRPGRMERMQVNRLPPPPPPPPPGQFQPRP